MIMKLHNFNPLMTIPDQYRELDITGITNDSHNVKSGDLFFAVPRFKNQWFALS
jgi:UDP-N-acetylmuramyl tripeptide synthase